MKIGIDISRTMSGGGKAHILGILQEVNPEQFNIDEIHVFGRELVLEQINNIGKPWIIKHSQPLLEKSLLHQLFWQYCHMPRQIKKYKCDILLSTDAGTLKVHNPSIVMSRDMLSFERTEIGRYPKYGKLWLRLLALRYIQIRSLKKATGVLFLTKYAADTILLWSGKIENHRIIPHGIGEHFKHKKKISNWPENNERSINCVYVSNTALYKHQWNVAEAIAQLRTEDVDVKITFIGGGSGPAQNLLTKTLKKIDPFSEFTFQDIFLPNKELPDKILEADVFIFASSCENMPNTLLEGMALGMPIICSDRGPMPEVLQDGGIYFNPENVNQIVDTLNIIIKNKEKRAYISARAYEISQQYSWNRCSNETFQYLADIVNKKAIK